MPLILPENYESPIDLMESQRAIKKIKDYFQQELAYGLNLRRVSAPLFVDPKTGLNDNLNGVERRVSFTLKDIDELEVEVVQSLAKWKRMALGKYAIEPGHGIYTDMNAIRRDEDLDNLHSVYVDQWDWEKVITKEQRTEAYLRETVTTIYNAIKNLGDYVNRLYRNIQTEIPNEIFFITTQELEDLYPDKTPKEREDIITKEHGAVFIMKIGGLLASGQRHDGRSPDYDDWELNGDIILWNEVLDRAFELSSMGIRVDADAMKRQLALAGCPAVPKGDPERGTAVYHRRRHRSEPALYVFSAQGAHRRGAGFCMAAGDDRAVRGSSHLFTVKYEMKLSSKGTGRRA